MPDQYPEPKDDGAPRELATREAVVGYLESLGGSLLDGSGRAASRLRQELGLNDSAKQTLAELERDGYIRRTIRGRRTFAIELVKAPPLPDETTSDLVPTGLGGTPEALPATMAHASPGTQPDADDVARRLLKLCLDMARTGTDPHLEELHAQVAELEAERDTLRSEVAALRSALAGADLTSADEQFLSWLATPGQD